MSQQTSKLLAIGLFVSLLLNVFAAGFFIGKPDPFDHKRTDRERPPVSERDSRRF